MSAPQLGKTVALGLWLLVGATRDAQAGISYPSWWAAPTYAMAGQGFEKIVEMARSANLLREHRLTPFPSLRTINGGVIECRSWDNPESIYGPTVSRIAVDEFGYLTSESHAALRSRVSETRTKGLGFMRYAGNVGEIGGEAEALWRHATSGAPGWAARTWTWRDRSRAASCECGLNGQGEEIDHASFHDPACERGRYLAELGDLRQRMSALHFRQLYGAEWVDWSSLPVYSFDRSLHVDAGVELDPSLPLDLSVDFNVDPMSWIVGQHHGDRAWVADEIIIEGGTTTGATVKEFLRRYPAWPAGLNLYGDASGRSKSTKSKQSDYDIIETELAGAGYVSVSFNVPTTNPPVAERINAVNVILESAPDERRYRVHPRCEALAMDLARVSYRPGSREVNKSDRRRTHQSDADGYRLAWEFPVQGIAHHSEASVSAVNFHGGVLTMDY